MRSTLVAEGSTGNLFSEKLMLKICCERVRKSWQKQCALISVETSAKCHCQKFVINLTSGQIFTFPGSFQSVDWGSIIPRTGLKIADMRISNIAEGSAYRRG